MFVYHRGMKLWVRSFILTSFVFALCTTHTLPCSAQGDQAPPAQQGEGAPQAPTVPPELSGPGATLDTFLEAMTANPRDWEGAARCLELSAAERDAARDVAQRLYLVLRGLESESWRRRGFRGGLRPPLPSAEDLASQGRSEFRYFPRSGVHDWVPNEARTAGSIVIARQQSGAWLFSSETCENISELYDALSPIINVTSNDLSALPFSLWIETQLPESLVQGKALGLKYWQWLGLLALVFVGVVLDFLLRAILAAIAQSAIRKRGGEATRDTLKKTVRPFGLFAAAIFWLYTLELLGLPLPAMRFVSPVVKFFAMLASVWAAYRVTDLLSEVFASKASRTSTKIDDLLIPLVRKTLKVFITVMGLIYIANSFDVEILPLLTGLGIGSLAFAFAAKDTIENFFGSVAVIVDRPFEVGDWVQIGDVEGTVEELGFRSTRVRTFYNSLVTLPNATLVRATVDNYGKRKYRRWKTYVNITYDTSPETIVAFCEGIRELIRMHPYTRKDYYQVWLHQFGSHSLDILVYVFHEAPDWQTELRERERLMLDIMRLAEKLGVEFAFPTQTLHVFNDEPHEAGSVVESKAGDVTPDAEREGRRIVREMTRNFAWRRAKPGPYRISGTSHIEAGDDEDETQIESKVGGDA